MLEISQNLGRVPENAGYLASMFFEHLPIFIVREVEKWRINCFEHKIDTI